MSVLSPKQVLRVCAAIILLILCAAIGTGAALLWQWPANQESAVWLAPGEPAQRILPQFPHRWLQPLPQLLVRTVLHRLTVQAGFYRITTDTTLASLLERIHRGQSNLVSITVPEGLNSWEIAERLDSAKIVDRDEFRRACTDQQLIAELTGVNAQHCEGFLFPDTYRFVPFQSGSRTMRVLLGTWRQKTEALFNEYNLSDPVSRYRVLILASLVEKETGIRSEQPLIASVFLNRGVQGMRLQSDPTTIYGIWERYDGNLTKEDLDEKTAWNTYRIHGLPPTPIANPGLSALSAVLRPAASNYLYFVADGSGGHRFSSSYRDHINAVNRFQKKRR